MKVLIISWHFPPANTIGGVRLGKLARFLDQRGHEVRVLCAANPGVGQTLPLEIAPERMLRTPSYDVNFVPTLAGRLWRRLSPPANGHQAAAATTPLPPPSDGPLQKLRDIYMNLTNFPDRHIGWLPAALAGLAPLCRDWRPDLIYASGPPFTGLIVGRQASRRLGVPWIAELRDRWVDDPYSVPPAWRYWIMERLERWTLATACGLVTVSEPWATFYRGKYGKPVATIYNGYDPKDFPLTEDDGGDPDPEVLTVVHAGAIYPGRRDPTPLFEALQRLGERRRFVRIAFYGDLAETVVAAAERLGVGDRVVIRRPVPYRDSLQLQRAADVLLLLQWNNPREQGNVPGKLFEYFGVLRPILAIGLADGVPATLIRQRQAGLSSNDPAEIAAQLDAWIRQKHTLGKLPGLPQAARQGLSRDLQFERLERFCLAQLVPATPTAAAA